MATAPKTPSTPDTFELRRPIGPLPLWAWIVVGAIAAFLVWRRRTEPGWFPGASYPIFGGGAGTGRGFGGVSVGMMNGGEREQVGAQEAPEAPDVPPPASAGGGFASLGRDQAPSPITAGGPDGTVERAPRVTASPYTLLYGQGGNLYSISDPTTGKTLWVRPPSGRTR